jgi:septal ring factor EnvC (AmiA/AmiB activator)
LPTRDAPGPRGLRTEVTVEAVVRRARQAGIDASPRAGLDLADAFARLENLTGQLIAMSDRAARAEVERDHLRRRLDEVKAESSSLVEAERRRTESERERGDRLVGELGDTREALTAERARADAMLAAVPRRKRHLFDRQATSAPEDRSVAAAAGS